MPAIDFERCRVTLVLAPVDGRSGYDRLAAVSRIHLGIDVDQKRDVLVFVSRRLSLAKVIWRDDAGRSMMTRWLNRGRFERLLCREGASPRTDLSRDELFSFLDGKSIQNRHISF